MKLVNFTGENLSKIHINQLMQFLQNHDLEYKLHKNRRWIMAWNSNTKYFTSAVFSFCNEYFRSSYNRDHAISVDAGAFHELVMHLYPEYVRRPHPIPRTLYSSVQRNNELPN